MKNFTQNKNYIKIFSAIIVLTVLVFLFTKFFSENRNEGPTIATVNDEKISKLDFEKKIKSFFGGNAIAKSKIPEVESLPNEVIEIIAKEIYLDKQIDKKAKDSGIAKNDEVKMLINAAKEKIIRQEYLNSVVSKEITEEKINQKYSEITAQLSGKKEFLVSIANFKSKEEAEKALKVIKSNPKKFQDFSQSPDKKSLGSSPKEYVLEDAMPKEVSEVVTKMTNGSVSSVIKNGLSWTIIKLVDSRNVTVQPFEALKDQIKEQMYKEKLEEIAMGGLKSAKVQILITKKEDKSEVEKLSKELKSEEKDDNNQEDQNANQKDSSKDSSLQTEEKPQENSDSVVPAQDSSSNENQENSVAVPSKVVKSGTTNTTSKNNKKEVEKKDKKKDAEKKSSNKKTPTNKDKNTKKEKQQKVKKEKQQKNDSSN